MACDAIERLSLGPVTVEAEFHRNANQRATRWMLGYGDVPMAGAAFELANADVPPVREVHVVRQTKELVEAERIRRHERNLYARGFR